MCVAKLTKDGEDVSDAKAVCKKLGLSVRGVGGEHTAAGKGGIVDISPSARFCIKEAEIITALYKGIEQLMERLALVHTSLSFSLSLSLTHTHNHNRELV